ncbi:MAG: hypothetical protein R3D29_09695 [Nitratireductor sp.]
MMGLGAYILQKARTGSECSACMAPMKPDRVAMHDCDVMICIGARFDDRITGRIDAPSPKSKKFYNRH